MVGMAKIAVGPITCQHVAINKWFQCGIPARLLAKKSQRGAVGPPNVAPFSVEIYENKQVAGRV
jgi:hypothetical protein